MQTRFSTTGIYAKDIEEQPQANLKVFGVGADIRLCRIVINMNRLRMLGVIDTEHISRLSLPR